MKISKNGSGVKVVITSEELDYLGLEFSDFGDATLTSRIFISGIISMVRQLEITDLGENICAKAARSQDNLIIYLSPEKAKKQRERTYVTYAFNSPEDLIEFCTSVLKKYTNRIDECSLYTIEEGYRLNVIFRYAGSTFSSKKDLKNGAVINRFSFAKTAEYATLLSHNPLEKIFDLQL